MVNIDMVDIIAGVYESDYEELARKISLVATSGEDGAWVQIDIADGTLVPVIAASDMDKLSPLIAQHPELSFEAHLMVLQPEKYIKSLVDAGCKRIIAHVECEDPRHFLDAVKFESVEAGLAIDAPTELEDLEPFIEELDVVLVMTIEMGASGQKLLPETIEKIKHIHEGYPNLPIEADGGVNDQTIRVLADAGVTRAVSTTFIFSEPKHIARKIQTLQKPS